MMTNGGPTNFGDLIKRYRIAAGLTQEELAERAGLSARGISDLERGRRTKPYYDTVRHLADALALSADARTSLVAAARVDLTGDPPPPAADAPAALPSSLTSLIGRDEDVRSIGQLLDHVGIRLVNLTGPGGVGKSRLALEIADKHRASFPGGLFFVPLAALRDPCLVPTTVAHQVGLRNASAETAVSALAAYLRGKRALLVLDNFEHLLDAAPALSELLTQCPELKILTTSRASLHLTVEHEYVVSPLALPDRGHAVDLEQLRCSPAAALFLERLGAFQSDSAESEANAPAIVDVCWRVDGLPLAIELAAARVRYLSIAELAVRLQRCLSILTHGPRDLPPRQQTLRDTIAWSYDLLSSEEQRSFRWLAVFAGGWTMERAEALCRREGDEQTDIIDRMAALIDNSLVRVERGLDGHTRYSMLETIREFAEEQLVASGEAEIARRRHADVMLEYTARIDHGLESAERTVWARSAPAEVDNVRAALTWSLEHDETERALCIIGNLDWFWDALGRDAEGWAWSQAALAKGSADRASWGYARALYGAGELAWNLGDFSRSGELLAESVSRFRVLGDGRSLALALLSLGLTTLYQGDRVTARVQVREAVTIYETIDDPWNLALARFALGEVLLPDHPEAARVAYNQSLADYRAIGDPWGIAHALSGLGGLAMRERNYAQARALLEEGLMLRKSVNNRGAIATSLVSIGELARRAGDGTQAIAYLEEGLAIFRSLGDAEHVAWALYNLGMVAICRRDPVAASIVLAESLELRVAQGNPAEIAKTLAAVVRVAMLQRDLENAAQLYGAVEEIRAAHRIEDPTDEDGDEERRVLELLSAQYGPKISQLRAAGRRLTLTNAIDRAGRILRNHRERPNR